MTSHVPSVQHFFSGVVVHHGVVLIQVCELYIGVPLLACRGVVSKVDGSGPAAIAIDTVNHSTGHKSIAHGAHWFCLRKKDAKVSKIRNTQIYNAVLAIFRPI